MANLFPRTFQIPHLETGSIPDVLCHASGCLKDQFSGGAYCETHQSERRRWMGERRAFRIERATALDYVLYIVQQGEDGPCKIGITRDFKKRLGQLQYSNPPILSRAFLRFATRIEAENMERHLHDWLRADRLRGEWFTCTDDVVATIALVKLGRIDLLRKLLDSGNTGI